MLRLFFVSQLHGLEEEEGCGDGKGIHCLKFVNFSLSQSETVKLFA